MKRIGKKLAGIICLILSLMSIYPLSVIAAAMELSIENSRVEEGEIHIYVNDSFAKAEYVPSMENFQITLGGKEIPCTDLKYFSDTDEAVSYIYLVDVSGSINETKLQNMKDFLKAVTRQIREQDQVCLVTFANNLSVGGFTNDRSEIERQVDGITGLIEDTNLYQGIVECLKMLDSREDSASRKALLILSDGEEVQPTGITKDEVIACLKETRIPVYTAAMLDAPWLSEQQESAKILGSFARESVGGVHTAFGLEEVSLEEGAARISDSIGGGMILSGNLSEYQPGSGQAYLQVTLKVDGKGKASDGYMVSEHELGIKEKIEEEDQEETEAEDKTEADTQPDTEEELPLETEMPEEENNIYLLPFIMGVVFALGCLVFVLLRRKNSKVKKMDIPEADLVNEGTEKPRGGENQEEQGAIESDSGKEDDMKLDSQGDQSLGKDQLESGNENIPSVVIYMTKIGLSEEKTFEIHIHGETTLGRQNEEADYAFPEDLHMSGVHCSLICYDGKIILQDKSSRNGTWVNGIPVTQPYVLKQDDVLHIGKTDFRVYW